MSYELSNKHPRDKHISFEPVSHTYQVILDGKEDTYISATTIIHKYFPEFNSEAVIKKMMASSNWKKSVYFGKSMEEIQQQWEDNRVAAANQGTKVHDWIENFYLNECNSPSDEANLNKSFQNFMEFYKDYGWKPYRTEWRVFTELYHVAGSIDIVFEGSKPGTVKVYDWKNSKEIKTENKYENGFYPLNHLPNCNFYHYSLQLNLYKWILETHYDLKVEEMGLIIVHESQPTYLKYDVKDMRQDIQKMLDHYKSR
jgi:ATP-dependent exoDNAse (exonuclease V) beta subunit